MKPFATSEYYYDGSIPEHHESEYDLPALNLGAETPSPWSATAHTLNDADDDEWAKLRAALQSHVPVPTRRTLWRSSSFTRKNRSWIDGDCGICFEAAVNPCRTLCCNKVFCKEHLTDWLDSSAADGRCPACEAPCTMAADTLALSPRSLSSPSPRILSPSPLKPPTSSLLFGPGIGNSSGQVQTPGSPISSGSTSNSSERSTSRSPTERFTSMRQRRSSSHLYSDFLDTDTEGDKTSADLVAPDTFVLLGSAGRILSLVGLLIVFYVVLS